MWGRSGGPVSLYGENYEHVSDRGDWDAVNRELFGEVMEKWPGNALALISNAHRGRTGLSRPHVRIAPGVAPEVRDILLRFGNEAFAEVYARARDKYPDVADCYRTRRLGLPDNSLVYLTEHRAQGYRTLLVFGGPYLRGKLEEKVARVSEILTRAEPARPAAGRADEAGAEPPAFSQPGSSAMVDRRAITRATVADLEAREAYLENRVGSLDYRERVELEKVQAELRRRSRVTQ